MRAPRILAYRATALALVVAVATVLVPLQGATAAPSAISQINAKNPPPLIDVVCASRANGTVRTPASGRCRRGEQRVVVTVGKPRLLCRTTSRALKLVGPGKRLSRAECRRQGTPVTVPGTVPVFVCRTSGGRARWIKGTQSCRRGEKLARFRNSKPFQLTLSNNTVTDRAAVGTTVGTFSAVDRNRDPLTWRLVPGAGSTDNAAFRLSGARLVTNRPVNALAKRTLSVRVEVRDAGGRLRSRAFTVQVAPLRATAVSLTPGSIAENATGTVGTLRTSPSVLTGTRYTLVAGPGDRDNGQFAISGTTLTLTSAADHEVDATRRVRVRSIDDRGVRVEQALVVSITDVNEAPTELTVTGTTVDENQPAGTVIGEVRATDPDANDVHSFSVDPSGDVEVRDGTLVTARRLSHRDSPLTVTVTATDRGGLTVERTVEITVGDIADDPTELTLSPATVAEFAAPGVVGDLSAQHDDGTAGLTYDLVTGAGDTDNGSFEIVGTTLRTRSVLKQSDGTSRSVRVRVRALDGGVLTTALTVTVTRTPTAPTDLTLDPATVAENQPADTRVGDLAALDPNIDESTTWTLVQDAGDDDADNDQFRIDGSVLRTAARFDHEAQDAHQILVKVTDADGLSATRAFTVQVTDVNEAPTGLTLDGTSVTEGRPDAPVGTLGAADPEQDLVTFTLPAGVRDNDQFRIVAGVLRTNAALAYADGATRTVRVTATDPGGAALSEDFTITVRKDPASPTDVQLSATVVAENSPTGTTIGTLRTTDPNPTDTHTYSLPRTGDSDWFTLDGDTLLTRGTWDFEQQPTRTVVVRSTDPDDASFERTFTITVTDVNEAPTALALDSDLVIDGSVDGEVGTVSATDVDAGDTLRYDLVPGTGDADNADFTLNASTGVLRTNGALSRADGATRSIRVEARDSGDLSVVDTFTLRVEIVPTAPTDLALSATEVAENQPLGTVVGTLTSTDRNTGDTFTYTLVSGTGDAANASFAIVGNELRTGSAFDYESTPLLSVRIRTTDQTGRSFEKPVAITVTDVDEAPVNLTLSQTTIPENSALGTVVGTLSASDPENQSLTWSGTSTPFAIDGDQLRVSGPLDFEARASYPLTLDVSDGTSASRLTVTVTVTDVNEAPTAITLSKHDIDENNAVAAVIGQLTAQDPDAGDTATFSTSTSGFVVGPQLRAAVSFDHEATPTRQVTVKVTDSGGLSITATFTITVNDVNEAPVVGNDTYSGLVGNVSARLGDSAPSGTGPSQRLTGALPLANDSDPEGASVAVVPGTVTTSRGGSVTIDATGQFFYTAPPGLRNVDDTFVHTVTDGTLGSTGTVTLKVADRRIWFVDATVATSGNGTTSAPFKTVNPLTTVVDADGAGDEIFLASGAHTFPSTGLTLEADQRLYGSAAGVQVGGADLIAPAASSSALSTGTVVTLANRSTVRDVNLISTTGPTISATGVDTATVAATATVRSGSGSALAISGGAGAMNLLAPVELGSGPINGPGVSVSGRSGTTTLGPISTIATGGGVAFTYAATVVLTGRLALDTGSRPGLVASNTTLTDSVGGHTFTSTTGTPLSLFDGSLTKDLTVARVSSNGAAYGVAVSGTGGTNGARVVLASTQAAPSVVNGSTGVGLQFINTASPSVSWTSVTNGAGDGLQVRDTTGALVLTRSTLTGNAEDQVQVAGGNGASGTTTITDNTITGGQSGLVLTRDGSAWSGAHRFDVARNTVSGSSSTAVLIGATGMPASGGFAGTVANNTIGAAAANSCSTTSNGIEINNEAGNGALTVTVADNTVTNCRLRGISLLAGDGNAGLQATVSGNRVSGSTDPVVGYGLDLTVGTTSTDLGTSCLDVTGNTLSSGAGLDGLRVRSRWGTTGLPGYAGAATDAAAVRTYLTTRNPGSSVLVTGGGFGAGTCTQP